MPRLVGQDDNFFKILKDDGEVLDVAKKGLGQSRTNYFNSLPSNEPENQSSINSQTVANMDERVEPKTGQVLQNINQAPMPQGAPMVADLNNDVRLVSGNVNPDPQQINPNDFAIPQQEAPQAAQSNPMQDFKQATMEEARLGSEGQQRQAAAYGDVMKEQETVDSRYDQLRNEVEEQKLQAQKNYQEVSDEYFNSKEIDQGRYWSNASTGQKILAGIGLAFASLNPQAMQSALGSINRAIDRDIEAQKLEILKKKEKMGQAKGLVAQFQKKFGSLAAAEQAAKMAALEKAKLKMEMIAGQTKSQTMQAKARQAISQIEMSMIEQKSKLDKELEKKRIDIGGYKGTINNVQEAKDFREAMNNLSGAKNSINRLLEINEQTGKSLSPNTRAEAKTLQKTLIGALRVPIVGPGAMSEKELELLNDLVANPTDIFALDSNNKTKLKTLMRTLEQKADEQAKNLGLEKYEGVGFKPE